MGGHFHCRLATLFGVLTPLLFAIPVSTSAIAGQAKGVFEVGIVIAGTPTPPPVKHNVKYGEGAVTPAVPRIPATTYTWRAAAISVKQAGYQHPRLQGVDDGLYWFRARKKGQGYDVAVSIQSGKVVKVVPD